MRVVEVETAIADLPDFFGLPRLRVPSFIYIGIVLLGGFVNILYDGMG